jgi:molecular chaperone HscA
MLKDSFATAEVDMRARALVEARVDADRLVLATRTALKADGDLLTEQDHAEIVTVIEALKAALSSQDAAVIEAACKTLAQATEPFAAMRMNRGISRALSGKNISTI